MPSRTGPAPSMLNCGVSLCCVRVTAKHGPGVKQGQLFDISVDKVDMHSAGCPFVLMQKTQDICNANDAII